MPSGVKKVLYDTNAASSVLFFFFFFKKNLFAIIEVIKIKCIFNRHICFILTVKSEHVLKT